MDGKLLSPTLRANPSLLSHQPTPLFKPRPPPRTVAFPLASLNAGDPAPTSDEAVNDGNEDGISSSKRATPSSGSGDSSRPARATAQPRQPPGTLNIRYRSISRKQARQKQKPAAPPPPPPPKTWEEMTLGEKAVELYVGEKGMLFWLNKFAYASIFIVIGGWILFRFVGPYLGLYELDTAPLAPTSMFKG
ncbi:hypothetical protein Taro_022944 [Colocasia esculenta]|uniref:Uncharacterized protein n=1 Tax=Colocasia esculenta TaxID=4460 RepID=A0A843V537_COLES|nr:hypothetical protein [Colocasia esculenta]